MDLIAVVYCGCIVVRNRLHYSQDQQKRSSSASLLSKILAIQNSQISLTYSVVVTTWFSLPSSFAADTEGRQSGCRNNPLLQHLVYFSSTAALISSPAAVPKQTMEFLYSLQFPPFVTLFYKHATY